VLGLMSLTLSPLVSLDSMRLYVGALSDLARLQPSNIPVAWLALAELAGVYALHFLPWLVFATWLSLRHNAGPVHDLTRLHALAGWTRWRHVMLPALLPGWLLGVGLMMLRIIEDAATPRRLEIDGLLATHLLEAAQSAGANPASTSAIMLMMVLAAALIVLIAWRGIFPRPRLRAMPACATTGRGLHPGAWLAMLPWLAIALFPYAAPALKSPLVPPEIAMVTTPDWLLTLAVFAVFCGSMLALGGFVLASAITRDGKLAGLVQQLACALLVLPTPVLAMLLTTGISEPGQPSSHQAWFAFSLAVAIKWLPLAQVLLASRWLTLPAGIFELARLRTGSNQPGASRRLLSTLLPTLVAVLLIGMLALTGDLSTSLLVLPAETTSPAAEIFRHGLQDQQGLALAWLTIAGVIFILATFVVLTQRAARCPRPRRRRASHPIMEPHG
jgi:ABC-type Fe3+ transport system permease subunit